MSDLAVVVLAHGDPVHFARLARALQGVDMFVHCDIRTSENVYRDMCEGQGTNVRFIERRRTPWAGWGLVDAELDGLRYALQFTEASHVAVMTGADYPLVPYEMIRLRLGRLGSRSAFPAFRLPVPYWRGQGGLARFRYRHAAWRRHMVRFPVRREVPKGIIPSGGPQVKVLCRRHVEGLVDIVGQRPDLVDYFTRVWVPDETCIPTLATSFIFDPEDPKENLHSNLWYLKWGDRYSKSPAVLSEADYEELVRVSREIMTVEDFTGTNEDQVGVLFARKFSTDVSSVLLDRLDDLRVIET